jgi:hypothetical protein
MAMPKPDPRDVIDGAAAAAEDEADRAIAKLNGTVAITVAALATFMGICQVKADNIAQEMQRAQVDKLDYWNFYQARNVRQDLAEAHAVQLELSRDGAAPTLHPRFDEEIAKARALAQRQDVRKEELKKKAETAQAEFEVLGVRDDQFDVSEAMMAIAIAMLAVTALTRQWKLYWVALVPTGLGVLMGMAGLLGLPIYLHTVVRWLS